jgi:hypothetical protein
MNLTGYPDIMIKSQILHVNLDGLESSFFIFFNLFNFLVNLFIIIIFFIYII